MTDRQILLVIGQNVRKARLKAGLTQENLAELVEVHWQTIGYIENGKYPFSVATFVRIGQVLDISPNRLLDGMPEFNPALLKRVRKIQGRK